LFLKSTKVKLRAPDCVRRAYHRVGVADADAAVGLEADVLQLVGFGGDAELREGEESLVDFNRRSHERDNIKIFQYQI